MYITIWFLNNLPISTLHLNKFPLISVFDFCGSAISTGLRRAATWMADWVTEYTWLWVSDQTSHYYPCHMWEKLSCNSNVPQTAWHIIIWLFFKFSGSAPLRCVLFVSMGKKPTTRFDQECFALDCWWISSLSSSWHRKRSEIYAFNGKIKE